MQLLLLAASEETRPKMMKSIVAILILIVTVGAPGPVEKVNYTGYQVLQVRAETQQQLDYLIELSRSIDRPSDIRVLDFWHDPRRLGEAVDILTENGPLLKEKLTSKGISSSLLVRDVQSFLDKNLMDNAQSIAEGSNFTSTYHTYEEVIDYLYQLANTSALVSVTTIGVTYENRDIVAAKISTGGDGSATTKEAIYLECGMHAREWISISTCIWIIDELTTLYGQSAATTNLVDRFDWFITPISNPDGYVFSWLNDRLWRKNRRPNSLSTCIGVDSNRNFDANFGGIGSSTDPCSETYGGPSAFSEAESQAMRDQLLKIQNRTKAVVSIHNDAQLWISPYGYTTDLPADYVEMERVMAIGTAAIEATNGFQYPYGPGSEVLYFTSGTTKDYVYDTLRIIHAYTLELRTTVFGFITPATLIAPVATEAWNGIQAMANAIA